MNNQTIDVIEKRDIDRIFFSITIISQQIFFNDGNGYIYKRNIDVLIGCNINGVRKYITSVFDDEFTKTSDWYNLFLNFKSKGLKNAFFIITDNDNIVKAFKLAFTNAESFYYLFNNINKLSHYISFSYSNNMIGKIKNICSSKYINEFNFKKEEMFNDYVEFPFIIDILNDLFDNYIPYFKYPFVVRKHLLSIYFIRDIKKKLTFLSNSKSYFFNLNEFIELFIPTIQSFETKMYCGRKEWNEIITYLYEKDKELLLCEL